MTSKTAAIVLAAGKGTRMKSELPKVLHPVAHMPMLAHVLRGAHKAGCEEIVTIIAKDAEEVKTCAAHSLPDINIAIQTEQLGTAHATLVAKDALAGFDGHLLILFGDTPLITPDTLERLIATLSEKDKCGIAVLGFTPDDPGEYGRLIIDDDGYLTRIVEHRDATEDEVYIRLCNSGVMAIHKDLGFDLLKKIGNDNAKGEYYLTDAVALAIEAGYHCRVMETEDETEVMGVNSRAQLAEAEAAMQKRLRRQAMENGVTMLDPETVYLAGDTQFGKDVILQPNVYFGPEVVVGDQVEIRAFSHIEGTVIASHAIVGPFARLRPGTHIGEECKIGNFVEIKKAQIEQGAKISHLSYVGDAHIGEDANLGAGTITCNYDGFNKHHTEIGRDVFIGSNSALIAPVSIGDGAMVGAGSVVNKDVEAGALAIGRSKQLAKAHWAEEFKKKKRKQ